MDSNSSNGDVTYICEGCNRSFAHRSSLSLHCNGNEKKNKRPCLDLLKLKGKELKQMEATTVTKEEFDKIKAYLMSTHERILKMIQTDATKKTKVPKVELMPFGCSYPPPHVSKATVIKYFCNKRAGEFVISMFSQFHHRPESPDTMKHCSVYIPRTSHDHEVKVWDGQYWSTVKIYTMTYDFINGLIKMMGRWIDESDEDMNDLINQVDFSRWLWFSEKWIPDSEDDLKAKKKTYKDDYGREKWVHYDEMMTRLKTILLDEASRDKIKDNAKTHLSQLISS